MKEPHEMSMDELVAYQQDLMQQEANFRAEKRRVQGIIDLRTAEIERQRDLARMREKYGADVQIVGGVGGIESGEAHSG
jgi:hypothetical protein